MTLPILPVEDPQPQASRCVGTPAERLRIIALGQPVAGDDGVALWVEAKLRQALSAGELSCVELLSTTDPSHLLDWLRYPGPVRIVDAIVALDGSRDATAPTVGQLMELSASQLLALPSSSLSSHGLDPAQTLQLSQTLFPEETSPDVRFVAISITAPNRYASELSPAVQLGAERCVTHLLKLIRHDASNTLPPNRCPSDARI